MVNTHITHTQLQLLLKRQLTALKEVVECNKSISSLLATQGLPDCVVPSQTLQSLALPVGDVVKDADGRALQEPLLPGDGKKIRESKHCKGLFADADGLKKELVKNLTRQESNEESRYSPRGLWQSIARNENFKNVALTVIFLNTLWIAYDTDNNKAAVLCNAAPIFQIVENGFCIFFTFEVSMRFLAFDNKLEVFQEPSFLFDCFLVATMIWETWVQVALYLIFQQHDAGGTGGSSLLRIFRLFRIARSARALRLLKAAPEFMIYIKGLIFGLRSVLVTLALLTIVIYIFAIIFTQLLGDDPVWTDFTTVPESMHSLLMQGVFADQADTFNKLKDHAGFAYYMLFLLYMVIGSLTIANMLIGVLCDVVQKVADAESDGMAEAALQEKVLEIVTEINTDNDNSISEEEFYNGILMKQEIIEQLQELEVDVPALVDYAQQYLFLKRKEVTVAEFTQMLMELRGSNAATVKNLVDMRNMMMMRLSEVEDLVARD